jgi:hypothetical protein
MRSRARKHPIVLFVIFCAALSVHPTARPTSEASGAPAPAERSEPRGPCPCGTEPGRTRAPRPGAPLIPASIPGTGVTPAPGYHLDGKDAKPSG